MSKCFMVIEPKQISNADEADMADKSVSEVDSLIRVHPPDPLNPRSKKR